MLSKITCPVCELLCWTPTIFISSKLCMGVDGIDDDLTKIVWTCLSLLVHCGALFKVWSFSNCHENIPGPRLISTGINFLKKKIDTRFILSLNTEWLFSADLHQDFTLEYGVRGFCRRGHCWSFTSSQILRKLVRIVTRHLEVSLSRSELPKLCNLRWIVSDRKFEVIWRFSKILLVSQSGVAAAWCGLWATKFEVVWRFWETLGLFER